MKLFNLFLPVFLMLFSANAASSQEGIPQYTVQIGNFANPKPADFTGLNSLGFIYAKLRPGSYSDVFIGGYETEPAAAKVSETLKSKGYDNAFVSKLNVEGGETVTVIQLASKKSGEKISWEEWLKAERLYVTLNGTQVKILTGTYPDVEAAKKQLPRLKDLGFKDAFVRSINNALLHELTDFETGGAPKKKLIPLDFAAKKGEETQKAEEPQKKDSPKKEEVPTYYEETVTVVIGSPATTKKGVEKTTPPPPQPEKKAAPPVEKPVLTKKEADVLTPKEGAPFIRAEIKRTSALELQKILKAEGAYKGSLDGFYGKGTKAAYDQAQAMNRQLQKYRILSRYTPEPDSDAPRGSLQYHINNLWDDSQTSLDGLEASKSPVAKAYRAYFFFVKDGSGRDVNMLMNKAIAEAFAGKKAVNLPKFDYTATYAYDDLDQLLLHLRYVNEVSADELAIPCWLFRKHALAAMRAFEAKGTEEEFKMQSCGGFFEWEEVKTLDAMAQDIAAENEISEAKLTDSHSQLARLYLTPKALTDEERKSLELWNASLWKGLDAWSTRDPMLAELTTAFKINYFHSQALLEDYFLNEGFNEKEAKALALAAMKALVGHRLERFV